MSNYKWTVGQDVVIAGSAWRPGEGPKVATVEEITPAGNVRACGILFRKDGRSRGGWRFYTIRPATAEESRHRHMEDWRRARSEFYGGPVPEMCHDDAMDLAVRASIAGYAPAPGALILPHKCQDDALTWECERVVIGKWGSWFSTAAGRADSHRRGRQAVTGAGSYSGGFGRAGSGAHSVYFDFRDAATLGTLIAQVRERWGDWCIVCVCSTRADESGTWPEWHVTDDHASIGTEPSMGSATTEAEAWVKALESAPNR